MSTNPPDIDPPMEADPAVADAAANQATESKSLLNEHKGKLAIGVAATLGAMIYYNWRERQLAKKDPEGHARLQRLKAKVRSGENGVVAPGAAEIPGTDRSGGG
jgi:hypothetical protein